LTNSFKKLHVVGYLRTLTKWHCPHSHAADAAIDQYLLPAGRTAANLHQRIGGSRIFLDVVTLGTRASEASEH